MNDEYAEVNHKPEPLWTVDQVADYLTLNKMTVYRWIKDEKIKAVRIGKRVRIPVSEVRRIAGETQDELKSK